MERAEFIAKLRVARALVEKGWTQGVYYTSSIDTKPCWCLVGACMEAGLDEDDDIKGSSKLIAWNDRKGRTQAEVLACFDNSILALLAEGIAQIPSSEKP